MTARMSLPRRRARAHKMREAGASVREIAEFLGVSVSTAHGYLKAPAPAVVPIRNIQDAQGRPVAGAEPGNSRAVTHGATSERRLAPVRERQVGELRASYPRLDDRRLVLLADRLARIEVASEWLDRQAGIVRNADGEVYAVVKEVERWSARAEQVIAEVEAEHRKARRFEGLGEYLDGGLEAGADDAGE